MLIFLIGYMASGKTTVGKLLAEKLDYRFTDLDDEFEILTGMTIAEYFMKNGEKAFREKEREILRCHLTDTETVIATGGGTPGYSDNMELMNRHGVTVFLDVPVEIIVRRLAGEQLRRPVIKDIPNEDLALFIRGHLDSRRKLYELSAIRIPVSEDNDQEIINHLIFCIKSL